MSNTLLLKTDGSINTRSKVFPKLGKCNVAIYRRTNGADEVEIWTWGASHTENPISDLLLRNNHCLFFFLIRHLILPPMRL